METPKPPFPELPADLAGDIRGLVENTGKSAEKLGLQTAQELITLGSGAIMALLRHWAGQYKNILVTESGLLPRDEGYADEVAHLKRLLPYARTSLTLPVDRDWLHFAESYCWMFAFDPLNEVWRWQSVSVLSQGFFRVCIGYGDDITRELHIGSPLIATTDDRRALEVELKGHVPWWLIASVAVEDLRPEEIKALRRELTKKRARRRTSS